MAKYKNRSRSLARDRFWSDKEKGRYACPDCARRHDEIRGTFEVHHKDGDVYNNSMENLVGLCPLCHAIREDRKPSSRTIQHALKQVNSPAQSSDHKNIPYKSIELLKTTIQRYGPRAGLYGQRNAKTLHSQLGYESESDLFSVRPKTRREVALFMAGRHDQHHFVWDLFGELSSDLDVDAYCERCGVESDEVGKYRDEDLSLRVRPTPEPERFEHTAVLCSKCTKSVFDSITESNISNDRLEKEIKKEIHTHAGKGADRTIENTEAKYEWQAKKVYENMQRCDFSGCQSDSDWVFQLNPFPRSCSADSLRDITVSFVSICDDHITKVEEEFENGNLVCPTDAFFKYILRGND